MSDVEIYQEGSIVVFMCESQDARDWVEENLALEPWQWMGLSFGIDPRFAGAIVAGMQDHGLNVERCA